MSDKRNQPADDVGVFAAIVGTILIVGFLIAATSLYKGLCPESYERTMTTVGNSLERQSREFQSYISETNENFHRFIDDLKQRKFCPCD